MNINTFFQTDNKTLEEEKKNIFFCNNKIQSKIFTKRLSLTARIVLANEYEHISVPFLKWQTLSLRGAWLLTSAVNELENRRSIIQTSS
jgi:hypothetical protein